MVQTTTWCISTFLEQLNLRSITVSFNSLINKANKIISVSLGQDSFCFFNRVICSGHLKFIQHLLSSVNKGFYSYMFNWLRAFCDRHLWPVHFAARNTVDRTFRGPWMLNLLVLVTRLILYCLLIYVRSLLYISA